MSGQRYITQAIIAALCEHPDQDKYKTRAFEGENLKKVMDALSGKGQKLSKADLFMPDDEGKFIIDTPGFWRNFDRILSVVAQNGEFFVAEDFSKPLNGREDGRTLLDSAAQHNGLGALFSRAAWQGRFDDMERLWFSLMPSNRQKLFGNGGYLDWDLKRDLLAAEGRKMPEDGLAVIGMTSDDFGKALQDRTAYDTVKKSLAAKGDHLRKAYVLVPDREGNTTFARESAWRQYDDIVKTLARHGEVFDVCDFVRQNGTRLSILARAAEHNMLHQVFTPEHWVDRLDDMRALWGCVLPGWKKGLSTPKDFDLYYAKAEDLTYRDIVAATAIRSRTDLLSPLDGATDGTAVLPLGLKSTWDRFDQILSGIAAAKGENITLADLRSRSGGLGHSCLTSAVKFGAFDKVNQLLRQSGERMTVEDFLTADRHGVTLLDVLAERNELSRVFSPDLWTGRVTEMRALWQHVKVSDRKQVDINQAIVAAKQATMKQNAKDRFKFPKGPF